MRRSAFGLDDRASAGVAEGSRGLPGRSVDDEQVVRRLEVRSARRPQVPAASSVIVDVVVDGDDRLEAVRVPPEQADPSAWRASPARC
ncbi:MAG: hypothetical protein WKF58_11765 [Ilumatobacteraceae bacterium]